ncbi:RNA polymerase I-specific transcription initiation factor Rrn7 [Aspergillus floccosus]
MEYITRGVCGQEGCRERRYYLDNGLWFCRRGHQQEGRQVEEDPDDFGTQGKRNRVKKAIIEKGHKTYRGRHAYILFLQTYQLILWKQCSALVQNKGFPSQFEHVVRDLWALRLEKYEAKIREVSEDADTLEFFSSQPAVEPDDKLDALTSGGKRVQWPRLVDTIALCYLGALLMRLPISVGDFHRMVLREEVPYIRVIKSIPREIRDKLPQEYLSLIETTRLLKAEHLHKAVFELLLLYNQCFDIEFPPLNVPTLLYNYIRRLALPVELYPAVKRLRDLLGFTFEFPTKVIGKRKPLHLPEVQLVTLIVISTKLLFPFDDIERYPLSAKDPTTQVIDWKIWAQTQRQFDNRETSAGRIGKGNEITINEQDVFSLTPAQLDEYMDWYEKSWLDTTKESNPLADMFPISSNASDTQLNPRPATAADDDAATLDAMVQTATSDLRPRSIIPESDADVPRPGSSYARYRMDSDLPETARPFYETVAKVAGVSLATLVRSVSQAENRIIRWLDEQRRIEYFGGFETESSEDSDDDLGRLSEDSMSELDN